MTEEIEVRIEIEALAVGGSFVGTVLEGGGDIRGKKAFVRGGIPGEIVRARVTKNAKSFVEAETISIEKPSEKRVSAPCAFYEECGGCQLQHIPSEYQRELKLELVQSFLKVRGVVPKEPVTLLSKSLPDYSYRNRVTLHLAAPDKIGFYRTGTGDVVSIDHCLIASDIVNEAIARLLPLVKDIGPHVPSLVIEEGVPDVSVVCKMHHDAKDKAIEIVVRSISSVFERAQVKKGRKVVFRNEMAGDSTGHFSQVNSHANEVLVDAVLERMVGQEIDDLYAGSGNFSLPLAERGASVRAVELDAVLVKAGKAKVGSMDISGQITFVESSCERFAKAETLRTSVLLDPPRAGAKDVVGSFDPRVTRDVVYVSCSLPTFARDAATLIEKGYTLLETRVVDMFPQTHHVELLSRFTS